MMRMSEPGYRVGEGFMERWSTGWPSILLAVFARQFFSLPSLPRAGFQIALVLSLLLAGAGSGRAVGNAPMAGIKTVATKGPGGSGSIAASASTAAASIDKPWMRILLLSPSISDSTSVTVLGNEDLTLMRAFFVKPQTVIKIGFSDDPMMGMTCDHFSGSTNVKLKTVSFAQHSTELQRAQ